MTRTSDQNTRRSQTNQQQQPQSTLRSINNTNIYPISLNLSRIMTTTDDDNTKIRPGTSDLSKKTKRSRNTSRSKSSSSSSSSSLQQTTLRLTNDQKISVKIDKINEVKRPNDVVYPTRTSKGPTNQLNKSIRLISDSSNSQNRGGAGAGAGAGAGGEEGEEPICRSDKRSVTPPVAYQENVTSSKTIESVESELLSSSPQTSLPLKSLRSSKAQEQSSTKKLKRSSSTTDPKAEKRKRSPSRRSIESSESTKRHLAIQSTHKKTPQINSSKTISLKDIFKPTDRPSRSCSPLKNCSKSSGRRVSSISISSSSTVRSDERAVRSSPRNSTRSPSKPLSKGSSKLGNLSSGKQVFKTPGLADQSVRLGRTRSTFTEGAEQRSPSKSPSKSSEQGTTKKRDRKRSNSFKDRAEQKLPSKPLKALEENSNSKQTFPSKSPSKPSEKGTTKRKSVVKDTAEQIPPSRPCSEGVETVSSSKHITNDKSDQRTSAESLSKKSQQASAKQVAVVNDIHHHQSSPLKSIDPSTNKRVTEINTAKTTPPRQLRVTKPSSPTGSDLEDNDLGCSLGGIDPKNLKRTTRPNPTKYLTSQTSRKPEKFSLEQMLMDEAKQTSEKVELKRKREQIEILGFLDETLPEQISDVFETMDELMGTPDKKKNKNDQADNGKRKKRSSLRNDPLNMNLQDCTGSIEEGGQKDFLIGKEDLNRLGLNLNNSQSSVVKPEVKHILLQEIESNQKAIYNRGNSFRQIFDDQLVRESFLHPSEDTVSIDLKEEIKKAKIDEEYSEAVELNGEEMEFLEEIVDNLNFGIRKPVCLSIDLLRCLPRSLTTSDRPISPSSILIQRVILNSLYSSICDPIYPNEFSQRCIYILETCIQSFNYLRPEEDGGEEISMGRLMKNSKSFEWQRMLERSLIELGLKADQVQLREEEVDYRVRGVGPRAAIERIDLILQAVEKLILGSCFDLVSQAWIFSIALRLGIDPSLNVLSPSITSLIRTILLKKTPTIGTPSSIQPKQLQTTLTPSKSTPNSKSSSLPSLNVWVSYMKKVIEIGLEVKTWKNKLEVLRLIPLESEFRKWAALAILELTNREFLESFEADELGLLNSISEAIWWMFRISSGFKKAPSPKDLYEAIKETNPRPYQLKFKKRNKTSAEVITLKEEGKGVTEGEIIGSENKREETKRNVEIKRFKTPFDIASGSKNASSSEKEETGRSIEENDQQINSLIEIYQIALNGIWNYISDPNHQREQKKNFPGSNTNNSSRSDENSGKVAVEGEEDFGNFGIVPKEDCFRESGNVWIRSIESSLGELDRQIRQNIKSSNDQADRVRLKNTIYRVYVSLGFMNKESFMNVKGVDFSGQYKLTRFFEKEK